MVHQHSSKIHQDSQQLHKNSFHQNKTCATHVASHRPRLARLSCARPPASCETVRAVACGNVVGLAREVAHGTVWIMHMRHRVVAARPRSVPLARVLASLMCPEHVGDLTGPFDVPLARRRVASLEGATAPKHHPRLAWVRTAAPAPRPATHAAVAVFGHPMRASSTVESITDG